MPATLFIHSMVFFHRSTHLGVAGYYKSSPCSFFLSHFPSVKYILCQSPFSKSTCSTFCLFSFTVFFSPFVVGNPVQFIHSPRCKQKKYDDIINNNHRRRMTDRRLHTRSSQSSHSSRWLAHTRTRPSTQPVVGCCHYWYYYVVRPIRKQNVLVDCHSSADAGRGGGVINGAAASARNHIYDRTIICIKVGCHSSADDDDDQRRQTRNRNIIRYDKLPKEEEIKEEEVIGRDQSSGFLDLMEVPSLPISMMRVFTAIHHLPKKNHDHTNTTTTGMMIDDECRRQGDIARGWLLSMPAGSTFFAKW